MGVDVGADVAAHRLVEVAVGGDLGDDLRRSPGRPAPPGAARAPFASAAIAGSVVTQGLPRPLLVGRLYAAHNPDRPTSGPRSDVRWPGRTSESYATRTTRRRSMSDNTSTETDAVPHRAHEPGRPVRTRRPAERSRVRRLVAVHRAGCGRQGRRRTGAASAPRGRARRRPRRRARTGRCRAVRARPGEGRSAVRRPGVGGKLASAPRAPGLPRGRRDRRWTDHRRRGRLARRAAGAAGRRRTCSTRSPRRTSPSPTRR